MSLIDGFNDQRIVRFKTRNADTLERAPISSSGKPRRRIPAQVQTIQSIVAHAYGLANRDCMLREIREARFCLPRQIAIYLTRKLTPCSWPETGRAFQQHHTTCMASAAKIEKLAKADPEFADRIQDLEICVRRGIEAQVIEVKKTEIKKLEHMPAWAVRLEAKLDAVLEAR